LAAPCRRKTRHTEVAQCKGKVIRKNWTRYNVEEGTCKEQAFSKRHHTKPKGSHDIKNWDVKKQ
jgi:hypothetical protein